MGYYTEYKLAIVDGQVDSEAFIDTLNNVTGYAWEDEGDCYSPGDTIKWYEFDDNMKQIAKMYPDVLFRLRGDGEESGDIWQNFYKNNKSYKWRFGEVVFPQYDPEKMKEVK